MLQFQAVFHHITQQRETPKTNFPVDAVTHENGSPTPSATRISSLG